MIGLHPTPSHICAALPVTALEANIDATRATATALSGMSATRNSGALGQLALAHSVSVPSWELEL
jgi:hypothetical protein